MAPWVLSSLFLLLVRAVVAAAAPIGTAAECCCGDQLAYGDCCVLTKIEDNVCNADASNNCNFLGVGVGSGEACPEGGFKCSSDITCPTVPPGPTPTPAPTIQLPIDRDSCGSVIDFGQVDSEETCQRACEKYGIYCQLVGSIYACGSKYSEYENCRGDPVVECTCGSSFSTPSFTTLCKDEIPLPPFHCDTALGVTSEETCRTSCESLGVYCQPNAANETTCGSRYENLTGYMTCFCGPEESEQVLCGNACTTSAASLLSIVFSLVVGPIALAVSLFQ